MDVNAAYRVVKSLELTPAQEKQLVVLLKGEPGTWRVTRKAPVMTVKRAERIFTRMIRSKGS